MGVVRGTKHVHAGKADISGRLKGQGITRAHLARSKADTDGREETC